MADVLENVFQLLCSSQKIERDKGALELQRCLKDAPNNDLCKAVETHAQRLLDELATPWETKHGALTACKILLEDPKHGLSDGFTHACKDYSLRLSEDNEFRVRIAAGELL